MTTTNTVTVEAITFSNDDFDNDVTGYAVLDEERSVLFIHLDESAARQWVTDNGLVTP